MNHSPPWLRVLRLLLLVQVLTLPLLAAEGNLKEDLAKLQGKWKATVNSGEGSSIWTLEVTGNQSTLLIESKAGDLVFKGELDFKLEQHGSFKSYTYSNLKDITGGRERPLQLTDGRTKSSLYRFDSDTLTTISGFRADDDDKPVLIKWEKVLATKK